jgi:hypothetical protein
MVANKVLSNSVDTALLGCETPVEAPPMHRAEFESALKKLVAEVGARSNNQGCLACERCERSTDSTFCIDCKAVTRCNYCEGCDDCVDSSHLTGCTGCLGCSHCVASQRCTGSAYLVRSVGCVGCTYCFGCVGLHKKDFHILNEPYDRAAYFELTAKLSRELGL